MRSTNHADPTESETAVAATSDQAETSASSQPRSDTNRDERIRSAAYAAAERRGFSPGHEVEDWLEAEREIDATRAPEQGAATS